MIETQTSLNAWADETFGPTINIPHLITRANLEMAELLHEITMPVPNLDKVREECADVAHILCRISGLVGDDITEIFSLSITISPSSLYIPASRAFGMMAFIFERLSVRNVISDLELARHVGLITVKLAEICAATGGNLADEIDKKAVILRQRKWVKDGTGCGSHIRETE